VLHLHACNRIQYPVRICCLRIRTRWARSGFLFARNGQFCSCTRHERNPKISIGSFRLKLAHEDFYDLEFTRTTLVSHPNFSDTGAAQNLR
jgi:hypothetical protein